MGKLIQGEPILMIIKDLNQSDEVIEFLLGYAKNPNGYLLFSGRNGTGKSYAALSVYYTQTKYILPAFDNDAAIFITQSSLNSRWIDTLRNSADVPALINILCKTKLLVLDDLGTRTPTEAFMDFLYEIFDTRYNFRDQKATIITTNLDYPNLKEKFGEAITSRITSGKCFKFVGKDRRIEK